MSGKTITKSENWRQGERVRKRPLDFVHRIRRSRWKKTVRNSRRAGECACQKPFLFIPEKTKIQMSFQPCFLCRYHCWRHYWILIIRLLDSFIHIHRVEARKKEMKTERMLTKCRLFFDEKKNTSLRSTHAICECIFPLAMGGFATTNWKIENNTFCFVL